MTLFTRGTWERCRLVLSLGVQDSSGGTGQSHTLDGNSLLAITRDSDIASRSAFNPAEDGRIVMVRAQQLDRARERT